MDIITQPNIMFVLGLIGIGYSVFVSIYGPQKKAESNDLLLDQRASFLRDEYNTKFKDIQTKFDDLARENQNHLHTLESKLDALTTLVLSLSKDVVRIETTINIKLPK